MFERFPNQWTPVMPLSELDANPVGVELAGEALVLFSDKNGDWHALKDYCPHRGTKLSLGVVNQEGFLRCGYHGWRFDGSGACMGAPLNDLNASALGKIRPICTNKPSARGCTISPKMAAWREWMPSAPTSA